jgi:hypothetical protein
VVQAQEALQAVKGDKYEEYERRVERATSGARSDTAGHRPDGDGETAPTAPEPGTGAKDANATAPATAEEAAITWEKLSKTTLGEAPILLGSAAVSGLITGVTAVASATPADIAANVSSSVSGLASLETFGLASKKKGHFDATEREKVAPQFSHLAGRGGASAAAFGGEDIDDGDLSGPRAGMSGGGEHPDVGPVDDDFFAASPRKGDDGDAASGDARDWDEDSEDDDTEEDDGAPNADGDTKTKRATPKNPVVRWDDDDESSDDDGVSDREEKEKGSRRRSGGASEPLDGVASDADAETADETAEGASVPIGVVRQISAEDPFFGAAVREKRPVSSPLDPALANAARAAEVDLDPSAIAASLGSGSGSANLADAYETVDDSADFLGKTVSSALRLSGDGQDSSGKKKKEKKSKKKEKSFSGKTNDERSSSGSLPDRPDALFASAEKKEKKKKKKKKGGSDEGEKPKKPSKKVRDWDESESD